MGAIKRHQFFVGCFSKDKDLLWTGLAAAESFWTCECISKSGCRSKKSTAALFAVPLIIYPQTAEGEGRTRGRRSKIFYDEEAVHSRNRRRELRKKEAMKRWGRGRGERGRNSYARKEARREHVGEEIVRGGATSSSHPLLFNSVT